MLKLFSMGLVALLALVQGPFAAAQAWPARPLRIIVPFAPGAFTDSSARPAPAPRRTCR